MNPTVSPFGLAAAPAPPKPNGHSASASASAHASGQVTAAGWHIVQRSGSGLYVESDAGTLLFRIDPAAGVIYPYCKKTRREIGIPMALLQMVAI